MYFSSKPADFKFYTICLIKESYSFLYFFAGQQYLIIYCTPEAPTRGSPETRKEPGKDCTTHGTALAPNGTQEEHGKWKNEI